MNRQRPWLWMLAGFLATVAVCGGGTALLLRWAASRGGPAATPDVAAYLTQAVGTSQALTTPPGPPPLSPTPSTGAAPSAPPTLSPTPTLTPTLPPALRTSTPRCLAAGFVTDVTVPDGSEFAPGETFTKTWRLVNRGSCTWNTNFVLFFVRGEQMGAPDQVRLPKVVPPGDMVDISVAMQAPTAPGEYQGFWKLRSDKGTEFGVGADAAQPVWVLIRVVVTPTPTGTPTVTATATPTAAATATFTPTPGATPTATDTPAPPTSTPTDTPVPPTPTPTDTPTPVPTP